MTSIQFLIGDATAAGVPDDKIICHICNDIGRWGKGFVLALSKRWPQPEAAYRRWYEGRESNDFGLGAVQLTQVEPEVWVANMIAQHGVSRRRATGSQPPIRYEAVEAALTKVAEIAEDKGASVHMPRIGCGLAGGSWDRIEPIIERTLCAKGIRVFVYDLDFSTPYEPVCLLQRFASLGEYEEDFVSRCAPESQAGVRQLFTRPKWIATKRGIKTELALGGELWEWEASGFRQMAGASGLAVIREGDITRKWYLMRS